MHKIDLSGSCEVTIAGDNLIAKYPVKCKVCDNTLCVESCRDSKNTIYTSNSTYK